MEIWYILLIDEMKEYEQILDEQIIKFCILNFIMLHSLCLPDLGSSRKTVAKSQTWAVFVAFDEVERKPNFGCDFVELVVLCRVIF